MSQSTKTALWLQPHEPSLSDTTRGHRSSKWIGDVAEIATSPVSAATQTKVEKDYSARRKAASASIAILCSVARNFLLLPKKSPSAVSLATAPTAPANLSVSGRMIETWGRLGLMNSHGTGKIRLG